MSVSKHKRTAHNARAAMVEGLEPRRMLAADVKWALPIGAVQTAMATDFQGNAYVVGTFTGTVDFNPSKRVYAMTAKNALGDMFVARYDVNGAFRWGVQFGDATNTPVPV